MKLLIVRHGDPDYTIDSLTPKGWREADLLANRLAQLQKATFYVSPLGRAKDTAKATLERRNCTAVELPWLREFDAKIIRPDVNKEMIAWDWLPQDWVNEECFFDRKAWMTHPVMQAGTVSAEYQWVISEWDAFLAQHGYVREGNGYRAEQPNRDTIVLFCHFGLECVLLSRLLNLSPMILWHNFCAAPTSVTTVVTEERRKGIAMFRMSTFGDTSHLYAEKEPPAFAARFCETYDCETERHD